MSRQTREAEAYFGESLRTPSAFCVKAIPDYKAIAHARKVERRWMCFAYAMSAVMAAIIITEVASCL